MRKRTNLLFDREKLTNYVRFFGCMVLGIAAITGMAGTYCRLASSRQGRCAWAEASDIRIADK